MFYNIAEIIMESNIVKEVKVIFLDIDGVLNSEYSLEKLLEIKAKEILYIAPYHEHVKWLNYIIKETGAKVVISSSWRKDNNFHLHMILALAGFESDLFGHTPRMRDDERGGEIRKFITSVNMNNEEFKKHFLSGYGSLKYLGFV